MYSYRTPRIIATGFVVAFLATPAFADNTPTRSTRLQNCYALCDARFPEQADGFLKMNAHDRAVCRSDCYYRWTTIKERLGHPGSPQADAIPVGE